MIGGPDKWLFRDPGPTRIGINPAAVGVGPPTPRTLRFARMKNISVIAGLDPIAVTLELVVKSCVTGRDRASVRRTGTRRGLSRFGFNWLPPTRCDGCRVILFFGQRLLASVEVGLALLQLLLLLCLLFCGEALLDSAFNLGISFGVGLLFLTGYKGGRD